MKILTAEKVLAVTCTPTDGTICLLEPGLITRSNSTQPAEITFETYASKVFDTVIIVIIVTAIIMMVFGGVQYAASAVPGAKGAAKERIMGAIYGLLLALAAYLILKTITPDRLQFKIFK